MNIIKYGKLIQYPNDKDEIIEYKKILNDKGIEKIETLQYFKNNIIIFEKNIKYIDYISKEGDRLDLLAIKFYNNQNFWRIIYLFNIDIFANKLKFFLEPGIKIKIPIGI